MEIPSWEFEYQDLVNQAEEKIQIIDELFKKSDLPDEPNAIEIETLLIGIWEQFYS